MIGVRDDLAAFQADFARLLEQPGDRVDAASILPRRAAFDRFLELGLPTTRQEEWRTTPIAPMALRALPARATRSGGGPLPDAGGPLPEAMRRVLESLLATPGGPGEQGAPADSGTLRLVFLEGRLHAESSRLADLPAGLRLAGLAGTSGEAAPEPGFVLEDGSRVESHPFTLLNTALFEDGALIDVAPGVRVDFPIHLVFLCPGGAASHPRILVRAGEGSEVHLVETWAGDPEAANDPSFTNAVAEIEVGAGARVTHVKLQREAPAALHVARIEARVGRDGSFRSLSVSAGAAMARNDIRVRLAGPGAHTDLDGLFLATGRQHVDHHTVIDHLTEHGTSRETYKGILAGSARGVFDGKIIVRPGAQKTDARQTNRNLLLSNDALVDTKPQLEIHADDVKCAHAATIGRLDADALFYLRTRGLAPDEARGLLIVAFASDLLGRVDPPGLREYLESAGGHSLLAPVADAAGRDIAP